MYFNLLLLIACTILEFDLRDKKVVAVPRVHLSAHLVGGIRKSKGINKEDDTGEDQEESPDKLKIFRQECSEWCALVKSIENNGISFKDALSEEARIKKQRYDFMMNIFISNEKSHKRAKKHCNSCFHYMTPASFDRALLIEKATKNADSFTLLSHEHPSIRVI